MASSLDRYQRELGRRDLAPTTRSQYRQVLGAYEAFLGPADPSPEAAGDFLASLRAQGRAHATIGRYAIVLGGFHRFVGEPMTYRHRRKKTLPPYHRAEDVERILEQARHGFRKQPERARYRNHVLIATLAYTGIRRSEAIKLRVGDVDLKQGLMLVRDGKGGKDRAIPLHDALTPLLAGLCEGQPRRARVFRGISERRVNRMVSKVADACGVSSWHPHAFRHAFATRLVERGATLPEVQDLLGHADLETTARYLAFAPSGLRRTVALLDYVDGDRPGPAALHGSNGHSAARESGDTERSRHGAGANDLLVPG
ncbi:MAG: tyrosine-type recombinase/integrase [Chloroflexi bacterium]|nr:tyrosine-type recombinase/integrase [Chloroflexota bacterium]